MKFRKKPVEIQATRVADLLTAARSDWASLPEWIREAYEAGNVLFLRDHVSISTLEGQMLGERADWIIQGVKGELYPYKPDIFEAMQIPADATPAQAHEVYQWVESHIGSVPAPGYEHGDSDLSGITIDPADGLFVIRTLEGDMKAGLGDWIIRGAQGEFYPCKPDIFEATYDRVTAP